MINLLLEICMITIIIGQLLFLLNIMYFVIHGFILRRYRSYQIYDYQMSQMPKVSILIPVYNQGQHIKVTLDSLKNVWYPLDRYQIIVINDGSQDDTLEYIQKAMEQNGKIRLIDLKMNRGKRTALYNGIKQSFGQIIVTLDSDSIVRQDTIQQIVAPFMRDEEVGAVAGNIQITNEGFIPNMLRSAFAFGFQFIRKAQSVMGIVMCTPGALSAYRKSVFKQNQLLSWQKQIFFNKRASIGQDRALTNIVLENNYKIVYQNTAKGSTIVPTTYSKLCKMFMRWIRGDIRQNIFLFIPMCSMMTKKTVFNKYGLLFNYIMMNIWLLSPFIMLIYFLFSIFIGFFWYCLYTFIFTILWSSLPAFVYMKEKNHKNILYTYIFGFFNLLTLMWLIPYCWLSLAKSGWLTR